MSLSASTIPTDGDAKIRVAVLFQRFGPYHHARLNAAGQVLAVWGVEACAMEDIYAWDKVEGAAAFTRVTLTERNSGGRRWHQELRRQMWRALDEIKPQAVVIPGWSSPDAFSALVWCVKNRTPAVVMSESTAWDERRVTWKEWVKSRLVKLCAAGLAGGTPHADYLAQLGLPRERIFPGYDVVDNEYFQRQAEAVRDQSAKLRQQHQLPEKFFLASARFVEKKNLFRLLQAYARYRELAEKAESGKRKAESWDLVLLGDGALKSDLIRLISELRLQNCVHLPGFKQYDELPVYFGLAQVFVHASTTEQWGLVVNEAMASGLPVLVSSRCGCAMDLVSSGVNGFTFDPANVEELAQLLLRVSGDGFPLADFGAASRRIIANWGTERFAAGLRDAVTTALKNPRPPAGWLDRLLLQLLLRW
jgi:glycosyltransferase involved in cell wall biosynthesis